MDAFDVAVVGGGHAGCEAALAAARLGCRTVLLALDVKTIGWMPCNPSVGGPGKANLVREVDALGGAIGRLADATALQMKVLNTSKGPAVQALRAQADKRAYARAMQAELAASPNLTMREGLVEALACGADGRMILSLAEGTHLLARAVVLATGTFLRARMHCGFEQRPGGRVGERSADRLTESLHALGFTTGRLKTGTSPRVARASLDFEAMALAPGGAPERTFSFLGTPGGAPRPDLPCWLTHTTPETHAIIRANLDRSPMFAGVIEGVGPRYCPSIEDKVVRFADKEAHPVFVEPEGLDSDEMYLQGLSTSLPADVQLAIVRSVPGLTRAEILRPGYAVEYDYLPATQLFPTLQAKAVPAIFAAGQINGTSGYEEAAAQGLLAGLNAARFVRGEALVSLSRTDSYLGTLVDDLVTKDIREPYRMLTSRCEHRLTLRQDNADLRLTELGHEVGLVGQDRWDRLQAKRDALEAALRWLEGTFLHPAPRIDALLAEVGERLERGCTLSELLRRPPVTAELLWRIAPPPVQDDEALQEAAVQVKYAGYIARQQLQIDRLARLEDRAIPEDLDYAALPGLSNEARDKLTRVRPRTVGQAARVGGVTPADASLLLVHLEARRRGA